MKGCAMKISACRHRMLIAAAFAAAALSGCVVAPIGPYGGVVEVDPPPPRYEVIGSPPVTGYVWIGGYWNWVGGRHVWHSGHWAQPRPGYRWAPHRWERSGRGWRERPGRWERN